MRETLTGRVVPLTILLMALCALILTLSGERPTQAQEQPPETPGKPNVILFIADDMRADELKYMPNLRATFEDNGLSVVDFENAFATGVTCCPTRATILTGNYIHTHRVLTNGPRTGGLEKFKRREGDTIATRMKAAGYETMLAGKYLNGYSQRTDGTYVPRGWDRWRGWYNNNRELSEDGTPATTDPDKWQTTRVSEDGKVVDEGEHLTDYITGEATDLIETSEEKPVFAYLSYSGPHTPSVPPTRYTEDGVVEDSKLPRPPSFNEKDFSDKPAWLKKKRLLKRGQVQKMEKLHRGRVQSLAAIDDSVASVVEALRDSGKLENTYLIFTSDQGHHMGEHRLPPQKLTHFEEDIRIPLMIAGPDLEPADRDEVVLNNDFAPTIASFGGANLPNRDGRSLKRYLDDKASNDGPPRRNVLVEKWGASITPSSFKAVRTGNWKYVRHANGQRELYNVRRDPYEMRNVYAGTGKAVKNKLRGKLKRLSSCDAMECRRAENAH